MDISSNKKSLAEVLKLKFPDLSKIDLFKKNLNNIEKIIINLKEILSDTKDINIESIIIEVLENRQMDMMDFENKRKIIENKNTLNVFHWTGSLKKIFSEELLFLNNSINNLSLFNVKTNLLPDNLYKFTNLEKIIINFAWYKDIVWKNPLGLSKKDLHKFSDFIHLKEIHLNYEILNNDKRTEEAINNNEKQISVSRGLAKSDLKPFLKKWCLLIVNWKKI